MRNDMEYKLKHLAKFCCKPVTPKDYHLLAMAYELGFGIELPKKYNPTLNVWYQIDSAGELCYTNYSSKYGLDVLDFINKLRMSEEEARELEGDRVYIAKHSTLGLVLGSDNLIRKIIAHDGYKWQTNEDGTEATLHKRD